MKGTRLAICLIATACVVATSGVCFGKNEVFLKEESNLPNRTNDAPSKGAIIFIHGMGVKASTWDEMIPALAANVVDEYRIYRFQYDWENPVHENGAKLSDLLHQRSEKDPLVKEPILVGHSMGGVVARSYIVDCGGGFRKLVTLGSPHLGSPLADLAPVLSFLDEGNLGQGPRDISIGSNYLEDLNRRDNPRNWSRYVLFAGRIVAQRMPKPLDFMLNPVQFQRPYHKAKEIGWNISGGPLYLDNDGCVHVPSALILPPTGSIQGPERILTSMDHEQLQSRYPFGKSDGENIVLAYINNDFRFIEAWFGTHGTGGVATGCSKYESSRDSLFHEFVGVAGPIMELWNDVASIKDKMNKGGSAVLGKLLAAVHACCDLAGRIPDHVTVAGHVDIRIPKVGDVKHAIHELKAAADGLAPTTFKDLSLSVCKKILSRLVTLDGGARTMKQVSDGVPAGVSAGPFHASVPFVSGFKDHLHTARVQLTQLELDLRRLVEKLQNMEDLKKAPQCEQVAAMLKVLAERSRNPAAFLFPDVR